MSHITHVQSQVNNADALRAAVKALQEQHPEISLEENAAPRYWGSLFGGTEATVCEYVLRLPGKYDLGFKQQDDGSYSFQCDTELLTGGFGRGDVGRAIIGEHAAVLKQTYTVERMRLLARQRGHAFTAQKQSDGRIKLTITSK